ncbi:SGNH/GDSL hydrolase family protein [Streptomyces sp. NPDC004250]|uniref:SGNH/GDSL hydrolase family protein n=1 Tax=Streptomyces sp. NPDC004250 TaxID=3364692 RepID=UPI0036A6272E
MRRCATLVALLLAAAALPLSSADALPGHGTQGAAHRRSWTGTWAAAASGTVSDTGFPGYTLRNLVHTSIGGERIRVKLSNGLGTRPVLFAHSTVGLQRVPGSAAIAPRTLRDLTFDGHRAVTVPAGAEVYSDPVDLPVAEASDLLVTTYTPEPSGPVTQHGTGLATSYYATDGEDHARDIDGGGLPQTTQSWHYVTEVDVQLGPADAAAGSGAVVALGDSITDGLASTPGTNRRWPDLLATRLRTSPGPVSRLGVLNAGISGNRVLTDGGGPSATARLERDVLRRAGARTLIVLEGINDIQQIPRQGDADQIIAGLQEIANRSHTAGLRVLGGTITPFKGWGSYSPQQEAARASVNAWIRHGGAFDAVVDFDAAVRDPADPHRMAARFDSGDHLHPNDAGLRAMADSVDVRSLGGPGPVRPTSGHRPERSLSVATAPRRAVVLADRASTVSFATRTTVQGAGTVRGTVTAMLGGTRQERSFAVPSGGRFAQVDMTQDITVPATLAPGEHPARFTVRTQDGRARTTTAVLDVRRLGCGPSDDSCPLDLTAAYDRDSIATAGHPDDGNFDGLGWSYAAETLPAAGPTVLAGAPFAFPSSAYGVQNTVTARGQTLALPEVQARELHVLGAASGGTVEGVIAVTYADGSTTALPLSFSDWAGGPSSGETVAASAPYRYRAGVGRVGPSVSVYARNVPLDPARAVRSVRLPDDVRLKLFAMTVDRTR